MHKHITATNLVTTGTREDIYKSCKHLSIYSNEIKSGAKKDELVAAVVNIQRYKPHTSCDRIYCFNAKAITLDDEQYTIVTSPLTNNLRVIAGAGSGKSTTLLCKIKYMIDHNIHPSKNTVNDI